MDIGSHQCKFLIERGLKPSHSLLDIGCGRLRGGRHFITYLATGCYCGIDTSANCLAFATDVIAGNPALRLRQPRLLCDPNFTFAEFGQRFDFALAQSLFTHLPWNSILHCLLKVKLVLAKTGEFYATFFNAGRGFHKTEPIIHAPAGIKTYLHRDPYHYDVHTLGNLAKRCNLSLDYYGQWGHHHGQEMVIFRHQ